jgi:hypothetical protein
MISPVKGKLIVQGSKGEPLPSIPVSIQMISPVKGKSGTILAGAQAFMFPFK